ncbi:MAG TPA: hypothetical protein VMI72_16290 [Roseiarcus sp.]|nr:hypothetical protein [Roseiarcus sp.]
MARDRDAQLRNIIAGYGDSIRLSDIKANIAVLFVAIMMGTVVQYHDLYPWYLSLPVVLAPFLFIFMSLLISVYPRYPRDGQDRFPLRRRIEPGDFDFLAAPTNRDELAERCALLSRILWWKNITLQAAYVMSMTTLVVAAILVFVTWLNPSSPGSSGQTHAKRLSLSNRASTSATIAPSIALISKSFGV